MEKKKRKVIDIFITFLFFSYESGIKFVLKCSVGSQIAAHTLMETGNGLNEPNTIDL